MKFLVLGATGMAGHLIAIYLQEQGHDIITFSTTPFNYCNNIVGDALNTNLLRRTILDNEYDIVINCIGILNQAANEHKANAVFLNSYLPHYICQITRDTPTRLIHMSTDCVFSGKKGNYREDSFRDGESFYDISKALGEIDDHKNLTFRNSIIGPDMDINGIGLFNWFMKQHGEISGYTRAIWTGVTTLILAKAMEKAAIDKLTGLYNLVNNNTISKYDLLHLFNKFCRADELIIKTSEQVALNKSLINRRQDFDLIVPSYEEMVAEMWAWVEDHRSLYTHYFN
jgi:dTDP-4-dehydrorhamnose reductase